MRFDIHRSRQISRSKPLFKRSCGTSASNNPKGLKEGAVNRIERLSRLSLALIAITCLAFAERSYAQTEFCTQTANELLDACNASIQEDDAVGNAVCLNIANSSARTKCLDDLADSEAEATALCNGQHDTRIAACGVLGEARYDPALSPGLFDNPKNPSHPNPYFPLNVGRHWEYRSATELNTVDIVNETKLISGINCIVARDLVLVNGLTTEATDDWYASAKDGTAWYFGEETKDFETFKGDNPMRPELVDIEGSFKVGRDGAKPGIIALAAPKVGDAYFEEFSLGNAEDVTEILSTTYSFGKDATLDEGVPAELAQRFCAGNCIVTKNYSLLEPGVFAHKYYARGVGVILEVEGNDVSQLVNCNFDSRCQNLPVP